MLMVSLHKLRAGQKRSEKTLLLVKGKAHLRSNRRPLSLWQISRPIFSTLFPKNGIFLSLRVTETLTLLKQSLSEKKRVGRLSSSYEVTMMHEAM